MNLNFLIKSDPFLVFYFINYFKIVRKKFYYTKYVKLLGFGYRNG